MEAATIDDEEVEDVIKNPIVFCCIKCHVIVGDTYALLKTSPEMKAITLTGASRVSRSADVYTSKGGPDVGSTYFRFNCSNCQAVLGRYYLTTARDLDELREKFTFTVDAVESYELGKAQFGKAETVPEAASSTDPLVSDAVGAGAEVAEGAGGSARAAPAAGGLVRGGEDAEGLEADILKIQHVMMNLAERLEYQEQSTAQLLQTVQQLIANAHTQRSMQPQWVATESSNSNSNISSLQREPAAKRPRT